MNSRAKVEVTERTDDVNILPDCLDFVGCRIEDNNLAFGTFRQDTHGERMRLIERDRIKGKMDVIASGFLQLLDGVGVLVLSTMQRMVSELRRMGSYSIHVHQRQHPRRNS